MLELENFVGFSGSSEFLPQNFDTFDSKEKLRHMFLSLSSNILKDVCTFSTYEKKLLSSFSLNKIFEMKIKSMLPTSMILTYKQAKSFKVDPTSTKIVNNYLNKENKRVFLISDANLLNIAKLINRCFTNNYMQLLFCRDMLFHEFVFQKISKLHKDKKVLDEGESISIISENNTPLKIFTSWKNLDSKKLNITSDIKKAIKCIKKSEFKQVYLVYPKNDNFKKHIPVVSNQIKEDYRIKAIPYSLRSTLKNI